MAGRELLRDRRTALLCAVFAVTLFLGLWLAYFVGGGLHGLYADDWQYKFSAHDLTKDRWVIALNTTDYRPLGYFLAPNIAGTLPALELPIRIGIIAFHLANVFMLALLAFRLTRSRLVAVLSGAFFLLPIFANEGILWFSGAMFYTLPLFLLLLGMHLFLSYPGRSPLFLIGALVAWLAMSLIIEAGIFVVLLAPIMIYILLRKSSPPRARVWIAALAIFYLLVGVYLFFVLRTAPVTRGHGQPTLDPTIILTQRVPQTLSNLVGTLGDPVLRTGLSEAFDLGRQEWLSSVGGWLIVGCFVLGLAVIAYLLPLDGEENVARRTYLMLAAIGLGWTILATAPLFFIVGLGFTPRTLFFPSAGLSLALGGFVGWLTSLAGRWRQAAARAALLFAGIVLLYSSLTMAGLVKVYQLRWELDQRQMAALRATVPELPDFQVWMMPIGLDERSVSTVWGRQTLLDKALFGLFQVSWESEPALQMEYREPHISVIDRDNQGKAHLVGLDFAANGQIKTLIFQGAIRRDEVPVSRFLPFTIRGGRAILLNPLTIKQTDGTQTKVELPLVIQAAKNGAEVQKGNLVVEER